MSKMFLIAGEAGAGKTTLIRGALDAYPNDLRYLRTHTTRSPRPTPEAEPEYVFVDRGEYGRRRKASKKWDHDEFYGEYYGSDIAVAHGTLRTGTSLIVSTMADLAVVDTMRELYGEAADMVTVYVRTSRDLRMSRLAARAATVEATRVATDDTFTGQLESAVGVTDAVFMPSNDITQSSNIFNQLIAGYLYE